MPSTVCCSPIPLSYHPQLRYSLQQFPAISLPPLRQLSSASLHSTAPNPAAPRLLSSAALPPVALPPCCPAPRCPAPHSPAALIHILHLAALQSAARSLILRSCAYASLHPHLRPCYLWLSSEALRPTAPNPAAPQLLSTALHPCAPHPAIYQCSSYPYSRLPCIRNTSTGCLAPRCPAHGTSQRTKWGLPLSPLPAGGLSWPPEASR